MVHWLPSPLAPYKPSLATLATGAAVLGAVALVYRSWRKRLPKAGRPLPCPPLHPMWQNIPLVAAGMARGEHIDAVLMGLMADYPHLGKLFTLKLIQMDMVIVADPDAIKEIIFTHNFAKSPTYSSLHPFIGAKSMVASHGQVWSKQRKAFAPGFTFDFLKNLVPVFAAKTQLLVDKFAAVADSGAVISFHNEAILLTMDIICTVALSHHFGFMSSKEPPEVHQLFLALLHETAESARSPHLFWMRWLPWRWLRLRSIQSRFDSLLIDVIQHRLGTSHPAAPAGPKATSAIRVDASAATGRGQQPAPKAPVEDILGLAIQTAREEAARNQEGGALDLEDVLAQAKTFLFAGHGMCTFAVCVDTTATTAAFAVYEISRHAEVEAKVLEEVDRVLGGSAFPTTDQLKQLNYLACVIKEVLRLWPPGGTARIAPPGTVVQGYDVGGRPLYIPHFPLHRDPDFWGPDACEFRPERWQDTAYVASRHPYCYQPFSKGPRDCIGQTFAVLEAKTLLAMLYFRFTFKHVGLEEYQAYRITSTPAHGVRVLVHTRNKGA